MPLHFGFSAKNLGARAASSAVFSISARGSSAVIQIATTLVLARILVPGDFGLVGMVTPIIAVFMIFGNLGLTMAVLQRQDITAAQLSSLFYLSFGVSLALASVLYLSASQIAEFYETPQIIPIAELFSLVVIASGLGMLHTTLLQRNLNFGAILVAELLSHLLSSIIAIVMALRGFGFMALAWRAVLQPAIFTVVVGLRSGWLPGWPEFSAAVSGMFRFGGYSAGFSLVNVVGRQLDNVLIGWRYGHTELGPYSISYRLFLMPLQMITGPLGQVMIPVLARLQSENERFARWYLSIVRLISIFVFPPFLILPFFSSDLVLLILGPNWESVVPIIRWLLPVGALQACYTTIGWLMIATGRADRQFGWALITVPLFVVAFVAGLPWRAEGVAIAYALANLILFVPSFWYGSVGTPVRLRQILLAIAPGVLSAFAAIAVVLVGWPLLSQLSPNYKLVSAGIVTLVVIGVSISLTFGWTNVMVRVRTMIRERGFREDVGG